MGHVWALILSHFNSLATHSYSLPSTIAVTPARFRASISSHYVPELQEDFFVVLG